MIENPIQKLLQGRSLVLGSGSPRRKEFLTQMGLKFEVRKPELEEIYPSHLEGVQISEFLSRMKAEHLQKDFSSNEIGLTADTVVWHQGVSLAKPNNEMEAMEMISTLAGSWHEVMTSFTLFDAHKMITLSDVTKVSFMHLKEEEIAFYVQKEKPLDKAGAYGIQDWIGAIGIDRIEGNYNTVVGLPTHHFYQALKEFVL